MTKSHKTDRQRCSPNYMFNTYFLTPTSWRHVERYLYSSSHAQLNRFYPPFIPNATHMRLMCQALQTAISKEWK